MADENNSQILQEINELLDKLKTFPENENDASPEQKQEVKEIYKQIYQHKVSLSLESVKELNNSASYKNERKEALNDAWSIKRLKTLPQTKEELTNDDKETAQLCFMSMFNRLADNYRLSPEEKNILATYMPVFEAEAAGVLTMLKDKAAIIRQNYNAQTGQQDVPEAAPQPMSKEDKAKVALALNNFEKRLYNYAGRNADGTPKYGTPKHFGDKGKAKKEINEALRELSASLDEVSGEFSSDQIKRLQELLLPFDKSQNKALGISTKELLKKASEKDGNDYTPTPAFTQLHAQLQPEYEEKKAEAQARRERILFANEGSNRLRDIFAQVVAEAENIAETVDSDEPNIETGEESHEGGSTETGGGSLEDDDMPVTTVLNNPEDENEEEDMPVTTVLNNPEDENEDEDEPGLTYLNTEDEDELVLTELNNPEDEPLTEEDNENNTYLDEIRQSDNEAAYLANINPKISEASIIAAMNTGITSHEDDDGTTYDTFSPQNPAIALGNVDDLLAAYDYYNKTPDRDVEDIKEVIAENLKNFTNDPQSIEPDNAFALLTLADKLKDDEAYKETYTRFTQTLVGSLKQYDLETFKGLSEEDLAANFAAAEKDLNNKDIITDEFLESLVKDYQFTDDNGKELKDRNRGLLNPLRYLEGAGNDRKDTMDSLFEAARLLAAKELATQGVPEDPALRKQMLESKMREAVAQILAVKTDPALIDAADFITAAAKETTDNQLAANIAGIQQYFDTKKAEIEASQKTDEEKRQELQTLEENIRQAQETARQQYAQQLSSLQSVRQQTLQQLLAGDADTVNRIAAMQARKELGLPLNKEPDFEDDSGRVDEARKQAYLLAQDKYLKALKEGQKASTQFTKSELAGRLGGVMSAAHQFKTRAEQHYPKSKFSKAVTSWWDRIDKKLTEKLGKPYIMAKKIGKTIKKIAPGMAKGFAISAVAGMAGPVGIAALTGYYAVKNWKNVAKSLKDKDASSWKKAALVVGALATTALSAATATAGLSGIEAIGNSAVGQLCTNVVQHAGILGRAAFVAGASTLPNWVEMGVLKHKRKKLQKQIAQERDPQKLALLVQQQKKLDKQTALNNEELLTKGVSAATGAAAGGLVHHYVAPAVSSLFSHDAAAAVQTVDPAALDTAVPPVEQVTAADTTNVAAADTTTMHNHTEAAKLQSADAAADVAEKGSPNEQPENNKTLTPEQQAQAQANANLEAAQADGSGWSGQSDMQSMQKDMNAYAAKIGLNSEQASQTMENLAKGYGSNSYEAMHAALADPYALADKMGITNDVIASAQTAGIDIEHNFSGAVLNHLAAHPELAGNEGFQNYVAEHFDAQDRWHSTQPPVHHHNTPAHHPTQPANNPTEFDSRPSGLRPAAPEVRLEDLNAVLSGNGQQPQPPVVHPTEQVYAAHHPHQNPSMIRVDVYSDPLCGKINSNGNMTTGIYQDPRTGQFYEQQVTPAGTVHMNQRTEQNIIEECGFDRNYARGYGYGYRSAYGTGVVAYAPDKVNVGLEIGRTAADGVHILTDMADRLGVIGHRDSHNIHTVTGGLQAGSEVAERIYNLSKLTRA